MTTTTPEPLPEVEPTSTEVVAATFGLVDLTPAETLRLDGIVDAVNDYVRGLPKAERARGSLIWPASIVEGSTMLAGRLWLRKDTPGGVFAVTGGTVPIFVHRQDPDIALLLDLGDYAKPDAS
jgi:hypothetical protein